ncbi:MAG: MarR family transcriptional regulator [Hespellia sp.]|nr:MarR family transcriptional regulator [Hespellia sp.]
MIPLNPWEHQNSIKTLYANCVGEICTKHDISRMELDILLFLANNPLFDTATDIVEIRYLSKSQVSASIKLLEQRGFLRKEYTDHNRKTAHLRICGPAANIIHDGKYAQEKFLSLMLKGFSQEEINTIQQYNARIWQNIHTYLKEETE